MVGQVCLWLSSEITFMSSFLLLLALSLGQKQTNSKVLDTVYDYDIDSLMQQKQTGLRSG